MVKSRAGRKPTTTALRGITSLPSATYVWEVSAPEVREIAPNSYPECTLQTRGSEHKIVAKPRQVVLVLKNVGKKTTPGVGFSIRLKGRNPHGVAILTKRMHSLEMAHWRLSRVSCRLT